MIALDAAVRPSCVIGASVRVSVLELVMRFRNILRLLAGLNPKIPLSKNLVCKAEYG